MKVRYNHTAYCYPHKHTEIVTPTPYWTFLSPLKEHDAALWGHFKQVLKFPNALEPQSMILWALFSPVLNHVLVLSPSGATWCLTTSMCPHSWLRSQSSHKGSPETLSPGMQVWGTSCLPDAAGQKEGNEGKCLKIVPVRHIRTEFSMAEARAVDTASVLFLGQAPQLDIDLCLQCSESTLSPGLAFWRTST